MKKKMIRFPSIATVASVLRDINDSIRGDSAITDGTDVRLQVYENGEWSVHSGSSDYDQDHRGYWGAGSVPGKRFNSEDTARDLIEQAREEYAMNQL